MSKADNLLTVLTRLAQLQNQAADRLALQEVVSSLAEDSSPKAQLDQVEKIKLGSKAVAAVMADKIVLSCRITRSCG